METPKLKSEIVRRIVPVRGDILEKLKREILKKDSQVTENEANVADNNNLQSKEHPNNKQPLQPPDNKIIIQKVENVKIEVITTTGPPRRISSFFASEQIRNNSELASHIAPLAADDTLTQIAEAPPEQEIENSNSLKLLTAKVPKNNFNQTVPLKVVRVIRQPKPKPNLTQRYHTVVNMKASEASIKNASPAKPSLVDALHVQRQEVLNLDQHDVTSDPNRAPQEPQSADNAELEENCFGFTRKDQERAEFGYWGKILIKNTTEESCQKIPTVLPKVERLTEEQQVFSPELIGSSVNKTTPKVQSKIDKDQVTALITNTLQTQSKSSENKPIESMTSVMNLFPLSKKQEQSKVTEMNRLEPHVSKKKELHSTPRAPAKVKATPRSSKSTPKSAAITPKIPMKAPKVAPVTPKVTPVTPIVAPMTTKVAPLTQKSVTITPKVISNEVKIAETISKDAAALKVAPQPLKQTSLAPVPTTKTVTIAQGTGKVTRGANGARKMVLGSPTPTADKPKVTLASVTEVSKPSDIWTDLFTPAAKNLETQKSDVMIPSTSKASAEKKLTFTTNKAADGAKWQEDISIVIGETRIAQIDESLKEIPNIVTGNPIETENVELKLIIKHLLRFFGADSVLETLKFSGYDGSMGLDSDKDSSDDFDDDFPGSFDDTSNDASNMFEQTNDDSFKNQDRTDNNDSNADNLPGPSTSFAAQMFDFTIAPETLVQIPQPQKNDSQQQDIDTIKIEPTASPLKNSNLESQDASARVLTQDTTPMDISCDTLPTPAVILQTENQQESVNRKRKQDEKISVEESNPKKLKTARLPWKLLLDENRRKSLRSSSRESSLEPSSLHEVAILNDCCKPLEATTTISNAKEDVEKKLSQPTSRDSSSDSQTNNQSSVKSRKDLSPVESANDVALKNPKISKSRKSSLRQSTPDLLRDSSSKPIIKNSTPLTHKKSSKLKMQSDSDSEVSVINFRKTRSRRLAPLTSDSDAAEMFDKSLVKAENSVKAKDSNKPAKKANENQKSAESGEATKEKNYKNDKSSKQPPKKRGRPLRQSKIVTSSDSEYSDEPLIPRNNELKSRLISLDSNSLHKSSIQIRNNYLKSSDKQAIEVSQKVEQLATKLRLNKAADRTYATPPVTEKRPRLVTSASKGMKVENESNDNDDADTPGESSTPSGSSLAARSSDIRNRMRKLIEDQKSKLVVGSNCPSPDLIDAPIKQTSSRKQKHNDVSVVDKKIFVQQSLQIANENLVPYDEIMQVIKASGFVRKMGRGAQKLNKEEEKKFESILSDLKSQKYFRCGSCQYNVTKHKWIEHYADHGGFAWIDKFEPPILLDDWNELVRRYLNPVKYYKQLSLRCPNCGNERVSAFGHLSHFILCGESTETIESRKTECPTCKQRFFPFNVTLHRNKCQNVKVLANESIIKYEISEDEADVNEQVGLSGRKKRKAVKKAEKRFKRIIDDSYEVTDCISLRKGEIECIVCHRIDFETKEEALEHIRDEHKNSEGGCDFEGSDSDASVKEGDESTDDEGSSGVESSDIESENEEAGSDNHNKTYSFSQGKQSITETKEQKNARELVWSSNVPRAWNNSMSRSVMREFVNKYWKPESFPKMESKLLATSADPKKILISFNFNPKSLKFGVHDISQYNNNFENPFNKSWNQLEIGEQSSTKSTETIFCGGPVSSMDWAPSSGDKNHLAVACNSGNMGKNMELEQTSKSCVQLYELSGLSNDKFDSFDSSSKLKYVIIVNDGPIWCIKFHPCESEDKQQIGLLAITTANQSVLIYALPNRNDEKSRVLSLQPSSCCKLAASDLLFNEKFLLQTTKVNWFVKENGETILAAGFINGLVALWSIVDNPSKQTSYPIHVIQAHHESVTALDFKPSTFGEFHLLTASLDRKLKVFTFDDFRYQESSSYYSMSRVLSAEWCMHWPGYFIGFDECFTYTSGITYRQPMEFGMRNTTLLSLHSSSVVNFSINNWLDFAMFVTDSGEVFGCSPGPLMVQVSTKDKWSYYNCSMYSCTDYNKIVTENEDEEVGIVFCDFKTQTRQPKKLRLAPTNRINELLINQVCFNRNEKSYRFYALGYETGFVRIKYLKKAK